MHPTAPGYGSARPLRPTDQPDSPLATDRLDAAALERLVGTTDQQFYVCGPPAMVDDVSAALESIGATADGITFEN